MRSFSTLRPLGTARDFLYVGVVAVLVGVCPSSHAQSTLTASKKMDISIFGGYTTLAPDYNTARDNGFTVGANATRYFHFALKPGLEVRYTHATGSTVNESSILAGPRGQLEFGPFHPYADYLLGHGSIAYNFANPTNPATGAFTQALGGGVDFDVYRRLQVKADFQHQIWNFGNNYTLGPNVLTFGLTYRIPFRPREDKAMH